MITEGTVLIRGSCKDTAYKNIRHSVHSFRKVYGYGLSRTIPIMVTLPRKLLSSTSISVDKGGVQDRGDYGIMLRTTL